MKSLHSKLFTFGARHCAECQAPEAADFPVSYGSISYDVSSNPSRREMEGLRMSAEAPVPSRTSTASSRIFRALATACGTDCARLDPKCFPSIDGNLHVSNDAASSRRKELHPGERQSRSCDARERASGGGLLSNWTGLTLSRTTSINSINYRLQLSPFRSHTMSPKQISPSPISVSGRVIGRAQF